VLNIGGIANLSLLPAEGDVRGFDTGPGNGLLDAWCLRHRGTAFDQEGGFAASGRVDAQLLDILLGDPYFARHTPKSTGRDLFHVDWLEARLPKLAITPADVQATLLELSVRSIMEALRREQPGTQRLLVCGGGVHNRALMARLTALAAPIIVESTMTHGVDADFMEAMLFAWLARETLEQRSGNLPGVTGARGPRVLGAIYAA
jgi:anhydro-N-acetylmuramic acid kinase